MGFNIASFRHQKAENIQEYDLDAIGESRDQYINLISNNCELLYLGVYNYDPDYRKKDTSYRIDIREDFWCEKCWNGGSYGNECWCNNCREAYFGKICSKTLTDLGNNSKTMQAGEFLYYKIGGIELSEISIQIEVMGEVEVYMAFKIYEGETSNFYNSNKDMNTRLQNRTERYYINSEHQVLLLTIASLVQSHVIVNEYKEGKTIDVVIAILASIGAFFAVILGIVVMCIFRNNRSGRVDVQDNVEVRLNEAQIQRYFPKCLLQDIADAEFKITDLTTMEFLDNEPNPVSMLMPSITPSLLNQPQEPHTESLIECVICLQQIRGDDLVRISFCKHIFHDECLIMWFQRQTNCPYCRRNFSREKTMRDYQEIVRKGGKDLDGIDLCQAISKKALP